MDGITLCSQLQSLVNDMLVEPPTVVLVSKEGEGILLEDQVALVLDWGSNITGTSSNLLYNHFTYGSLIRAVKVYEQCTRIFCPIHRYMDFSLPRPRLTMIFVYLRVLESFPSALFDTSPLYREIAAFVAGGV